MVRFDPTVPVDGAEHAILALAAREQEGCVPCSDRAHRRRLAQQLPPMLPSWPRSCDRRTSLFISSRRYFEREPQSPRFTSTGRPHRSASDLRRLPSTFSEGDAALLYYGLLRSRAVVQLGQLDQRAQEATPGRFRRRFAPPPPVFSSEGAGTCGTGSGHAPRVRMIRVDRDLLAIRTRSGSVWAWRQSQSRLI